MGMALGMPAIRILRSNHMKVIYIVTIGIYNKYAFASKTKAAEFATQVDGVVDIVPFDPAAGYDGLGGDVNAD